MREEVSADEEMCDVSYHESPLEILTYSQIEAGGQPSLGRDNSAVSHTDVIIDVLLALWDGRQLSRIVTFLAIWPGSGRFATQTDVPGRW
jgi:hypothetical protein